MNGLSNKLVGLALIVGLLVSLAWTLPVDEEKTSLSPKDDAVNVEPVPVAEEYSVNGGQLRFPPFNNNGTGFFEKFGEKFRNKWTTSTTTSTRKPPRGENL
ncbi:uncharacterized protein [Drosophila kikkawai]|uniref:Secreted protein n=1 Tax=Drosophila kikkawai TaxID=30033 RepID=A0ABM3C4J9_DROKI|nr:uncharacterized protein LOC121501923 [Drosophila kikkawai]